MNVLFLTIGRITGVKERGIYTDLMRKFKSEQHNVYIVCPSERSYNEEVGLKEEDSIHILKVKTLNIQKTNFIEKGIATILVEGQFLKQIKKRFKAVKFDLVLYSTPPITFSKIIRYIKNRDGAISYLLLKDIFPQNAVDLGILKKSGLLYKFFLKKERELYRISDFIGCMSPANVDFLLKNNPEINPNKVEENPNSIDPVLKVLPVGQREKIREQYKIPQDATVFIYGGNLGKPQGIDFLIKFLNSNKALKNVFFVVVGNGTEYISINNALTEMNIENTMLLKGLPKDDYDLLLLACDVGLIFLDRRFTIPNYPSRLLSYMEAKMPILSATDVNTDIGRIMEENGYGLWAESGDLTNLNLKLTVFLQDKNKNKLMGQKAYQFMTNNYLVEYSYQKIMDKL